MTEPAAGQAAKPQGGNTMNTTTAATARELIAQAAAREFVRPQDARAGAVFERITVRSQSYFVKRLSAASDWVMRVTGDHVHRPYLVWRSGIMAQAPACIDHTVVAMDVTGGPGDDAVLTIVMRDVGGFLIPAGDAVVPAAQHARLIAHMAALEIREISTAGWWQEQLDLCLIGIMATFGWEKALGDQDELSWWEARVAAAAARQHLSFPDVRG